MLREKVEALHNNPSIGRIIGVLYEIACYIDKLEEEKKCLSAKSAKPTKK